jgi:hypothetical protein
MFTVGYKLNLKIQINLTLLSEQLMSTKLGRIAYETITD